jgi:hypothetical protein
LQAKQAANGGHEMPNWVVSPEDLKRGDLANVGWHPAQIFKYEEGEAGEEAKNPGSTTCSFYFRITDGLNAGIECRRLFSETAWGFAKSFFAVLDFPKDEKGNYKIGSQLFEQTVGHKLMIYIKRSKSNRGNEFNDVIDFRKVTE